MEKSGQISPLHLLLHLSAALLPLPPLLQQPAEGPAGQLAPQTLLKGERGPAQEEELPPVVESPVVLLNDHDALQQLPVLLPGGKAARETKVSFYGHTMNITWSLALNNTLPCSP